MDIDCKGGTKMLGSTYLDSRTPRLQVVRSTQKSMAH